MDKDYGTEEYENNRVINYEKKFNVTKLTNILKLMVSPKIKPKDVNIKLEELGFQHKDEQGKWTINAGLDDEKKKKKNFQSEHSHYRGTMILWKSKTLDVLIDEFGKDYLEGK